MAEKINQKNNWKSHLPGLNLLFLLLLNAKKAKKPNFFKRTCHLTKTKNPDNGIPTPFLGFDIIPSKNGGHRKTTKPKCSCGGIIKNKSPVIHKKRNIKNLGAHPLFSCNAPFSLVSVQKFGGHPFFFQFRRKIFIQ
ncbi:hypothetical protein [Flavobacterium procerum]|uniref:hypothetical protein n=1 Tax=Flavobacterium procerum TaxID=1455569 RepID=UPI00406BBACC